MSLTQQKLAGQSVIFSNTRGHNSFQFMNSVRNRIQVFEERGRDPGRLKRYEVLETRTW